MSFARHFNVRHLQRGATPNYWLDTGRIPPQRTALTRYLSSSNLHRTESTLTALPKSYVSIPGDWKGRLPILNAMPIFLPYVEKAGGIRLEDFMQNQYDKYGRITRWGWGNDKAVLMFHPEDYLEVVNRQGKYPMGILEGSWPMRQYNEKFVRGVTNPFLVHGEEWRRGRMALNPYIFNIQTARTYLGAINDVAAKASASFERYAAKGNLDRFCELASFDMFLAASLGLVMNSSAGKEEHANKIIGCITAAGNLAMQCPWSKHDIFKFKQWDNFVVDFRTGRETVKELIHLALHKGEGSGKGIIHGFLNDPDLTVSEEEATDMCLTLILAAADTTSSLVFNVLNNLAKHPSIQDRVREELKCNLKGEDYHADVKLPYLEQTLMECQRLTPPLPFVNVKSKIPEEIVVAGYRIPKGATVMFSHMGIKNDPAYAGENPHLFNPDRYSEEAVKARKGTRAEVLDHPLCSKPFGFGARMCVGSRVAKLEYMALVTRILQDYRLEYDEAKSKPAVRLTKATTMEYPCPRYRIARLQ